VLAREDVHLGDAITLRKPVGEQEFPTGLLRSLGHLDSNALVRVLLLLGAADRRFGDLQAAITHIERALSLADRAPRSSQPDRLRIRARVELGETLRVQGRCSDAEEVLHVALEMARASDLSGHEQMLGDVLGRLARLCLSTGRPADGLSPARRACEINNAVMGDEHAQSLMARATLACIEHAIGMDPRASKTLQTIIAQLEQARALDTEISLVLTDLARVHRDRFEFERARTSCQRAVELTQRAMGEGHSALAEPLLVLGDVLLELGERRLARRSLLQAFELLDGKVDGRHPVLVAARCSIQRLDDWSARLAAHLPSSGSGR